MKREEFAKITVGLCNKVLLKNEQPELPELSAKDWDELLNFASMQGLLPVITQLFIDRKIEDKQLSQFLVRWYGTSMGSSQKYQLQLKTMCALSKLMDAEGIDIMFMKGAALAQLYPKAEWRVFSDIDFYLFGESQRGIEVMAQKGIGNNSSSHHHTRAVLNGILLENHFNFVERKNHRGDVILDDVLKALADKEGKSVPATFLGEDIHNAYVMTPTMNAIFLMRHMSAHFFSETISLRMLYDWALFLKHQSKDVYWPYVVGLYEQTGMATFSEIIQMILYSHIGYDCKGCPIARSAQKDADKVWNSIIYPPKQTPYNKHTIRYYLFESKIFLANRWKYKMAYSGESYALMFLKYSWSGIKKMIRKVCFYPCIRDFC